MGSHRRAIHNNRAIPSKIIRNRGMDSSRAIHPKVEGIKIIRNRGMANNKIILHKGMVNNRDTLNKAIPNKVMPNSKTINNRAMDNHLPGMRRPKKRRP